MNTFDIAWKDSSLFKSSDLFGVPASDLFLTGPSDLKLGYQKVTLRNQEGVIQFHRPHFCR